MGENINVLLVPDAGSLNAAVVIYSPAVRSKDTVTSPEVRNADSTDIKKV